MFSPALSIEEMFLSFYNALEDGSFSMEKMEEIATHHGQEFVGPPCKERMNFDIQALLTFYLALIIPLVAMVYSVRSNATPFSDETSFSSTCCGALFNSSSASNHWYSNNLKTLPPVIFTLGIMPVALSLAGFSYQGRKPRSSSNSARNSSLCTWPEYPLNFAFYGSPKTEKFT